MCNRQPMAALSLLLLVLIVSKLKSILLKKKCSLALLLFLIFSFLFFLIQCRDWEDGMLHCHIHWLSAAEERGSRGRTKYCLPASCRQVRKQDGVIEISGLPTTASSNPPHFIDMTALRSWISMLKSMCCR